MSAPAGWPFNLMATKGCSTCGHSKPMAAKDIGTPEAPDHALRLRRLRQIHGQIPSPPRAGASVWPSPSAAAVQSAECVLRMELQLAGESIASGGRPIGWVVTPPPRQSTIRRWLDHLAAEGSRALRALEVGRIRMANEAVGQSSRVIVDHPSVVSLVSVDMNPETEGVTRSVLGGRCLKVRFINSKSHDALAQLRAEGERFSFIYLDGASDADICMGDLLGALEVSVKGTVIVLDDTDPAYDVKGALTVPWAQAHTDRVTIVEVVPSGEDCNGQVVLEVR